MSRGRQQGLSTEDGRRAVELARESVRKFVDHGRRADPGSMREAFYLRGGSMVRLETADGRGQLRGCQSAHDRPSELRGEDRQLGHAVVDAAVRAASSASRREVDPVELPNLRISVFGVLDYAVCSDPASEVVVGEHGLAIESGEATAWMYPTMPMTHEWSVYEYLDRTASKAGLARDAWAEDSVTVYRLGGQVFEERDPAGSVTRLL